MEYLKIRSGVFYMGRGGFYMKRKKEMLINMAKYKIIDDSICLIVPIICFLILLILRPQESILIGVGLIIPFVVWGRELIKIFDDIKKLHTETVIGQYLQTDPERLSAKPGYNYRIVIKSNIYEYFNSNQDVNYSRNDIIEIEYLKRSRIVVNSKLIESINKK